MKFSLIVPVYNVEKYIEKCLTSIKNQDYDNFEVIVVNDGTKDNSQKIIDSFVKDDKRFKSFHKKNGGLSDARNFGLRYVTGDYILFIDSDDYINKSLLSNLNRVAKDYDIIRYKLCLVSEDGTLIREESALNKNGDVSFEELVNLEFLEPAWIYAYRKDFFIENNFKYATGKIHEDFGLTPLCLVKAKKMYYLDYCGYNYVQRAGSIMNSSHGKKRLEDMLFHFDYLLKEIQIDKSIPSERKKIFLSFIANGILISSKNICKDDLQFYLKNLKERKVSSYLLDNTFKRKVKKLFVRFFPSLYIHILKR